VFDKLQAASTIDDQLWILSRFKPSALPRETQPVAREFKRRAYNAIRAKIWRAESKYLGIPKVSSEIERQSMKPLPELAPRVSSDEVAVQDRRIMRSGMIARGHYLRHVSDLREKIRALSDEVALDEFNKRIDRFERAESIEEVMRLTREIFDLSDAHVKDNGLHSGVALELGLIRQKLFDPEKVEQFRKKVFSRKVDATLVQQWMNEGKIEIRGDNSQQRRG